MAEKSIKKNYFYNLLYRVFLIIVPILVTPYVARVLGDDASGQYSFTVSIMTYFTVLAAFGFTLYAQREVAKVSDSKTDRSKVFWEIILCRAVSTAASTVVYVALLLGKVYAEKNTVAMWLLIIQVVATLFDITFFFQALEEFGKIVLRNVIIRGISIVLILTLVKSPDDLWIYVLIQSGTVLFSNVSLWGYMFKYLGKVPAKDLKPLRHFLPALILFLPTVATSIYTVLDKTLIGLITGSDSENGNYEYAESIVRMLLTAVTSLGVVLIPRNAKKFAEGDDDAIRENIRLSVNFAFFLGVPLMLGTIAISDNFVPWYLGPDYEKAADLMKVLSAIIVIVGLSNVFGLQYLVPSGNDKKFTISVAVGAVVNFGLNCLLIYYFQSMGAVIATVIAEFVILFIQYMFIRKKIQFARAVLSSWRYFVGGAAMFVPCYFMGLYLEPSVSSSVLIFVVGVVVYAVIMLVTRDRFVWGSIRRIADRIMARRLAKSGAATTENTAEDAVDNDGDTPQSENDESDKRDEGESGDSVTVDKNTECDKIVEEKQIIDDTADTDNIEKEGGQAPDDCDSTGKEGD